MRNRAAFPLWVAAFGIFAALRVGAVAGRPVRTFPDTAGYLQLSFVGHGRPWVVPLLYGALTTDGARVAAQCAISIACWCLLAYVAAGVVQSTALRVVLAAGILLIGATPAVSLWDLSLVSESLALSLAVAAISCWLLFAVRPTRTRMLAVWIVTLLWVFTRTAHLVLLPILLVLLAVSLAWRSERRRRAILLVALVPVTAWALITVRNDVGTNEYNTYAIIDLRVFGHADRLRYFEDHGMPASADSEGLPRFIVRGFVPPALVRDARVPVGLNVPVLVVTGGRPFVRWMHDDGPATYLKWLAVHPGYAVAEPLRNLDDLVAPRFDRITPPVQSRALLPSFVTVALFESLAVYLVALTAAMLSAVAAVLLKLFSRPLAVAWCVLGVSVALLYVSYLGSAIELGRHGIAASVGSRLAILMVLAFTADLYLATRRKQMGTEDSS